VHTAALSPCLGQQSCQHVAAATDSTGAVAAAAVQGALTVHEVLFVVGTRGGVQALHDYLLASLL
jgi:acyl transferase domain-containing protein